MDWIVGHSKIAGQELFMSHLPLWHGTPSCRKAPSMPLGRRPFSSMNCMLRRSSQAFTKSPLDFLRLIFRSSSESRGNMIFSSATLPSSSSVATLTSLESSRVANVSDKLSLKSVKSVKSPESVGCLVELDGLAKLYAMP